MQIKDACMCSAPRRRAAAAGARRRDRPARLGRGAQLRAAVRRGVRARRAGARRRSRARVPPDTSAPLIARFPGTASAAAISSTGSREAQHALSRRSPYADWSADAVDEVMGRVLGGGDAALDGLRRALRFVCEQICVPRLLRTPDELDHVIGALNGPSRTGGPERRADPRRLMCCRPGRNSTPSIRARCPPQLSYATGVGLANAVLERHLADTGKLPRMVGLVAWGTAAMRTQGTMPPRCSPPSACGRPGIPPRGASPASSHTRSRSSADRASTSRCASAVLPTTPSALARLLDDAVTMVAA